MIFIDKSLVNPFSGIGSSRCHQSNYGVFIMGPAWWPSCGGTLYWRSGRRLGNPGGYSYIGAADLRLLSGVWPREAGYRSPRTWREPRSPQHTPLSGEMWSQAIQAELEKMMLTVSRSRLRPGGYQWVWRSRPPPSLPRPGPMFAGSSGPWVGAVLRLQ